MKTNRFTLCRSGALTASLLASFFAASNASPAKAQAAAQADAAPASSTQSQIPARVTEKVDEANLATLQGNVHRLARPEFDRGAVSDAQIADHMVLLLQRSADQDAALTQLLNDQQDKSSKNYHAWLTPQQFGQQFGPADSDIQAVTDWLTSHGFSGIKVSPGRTRVEFSGNIGQVHNAFHTEIHHFFVNGEMHMANVSEPQIPAALVPVVAGVAYMHDFRPKSHAHNLGTFRRTKDTGEVRPLFTFSGCGSNCHAVGPGDFAAIYNVPATISGQPAGHGFTIGIVQDSNLNLADVQAYRNIFGLPATFTSSNIILNGPDPGIQDPTSATDDELEADLDAELSGGVAPGATINVVVSENSQSIGTAGIDLSAIYIIDNNAADILSESFGSCEPNLGSSGVAFYSALWQQAAAQGITVILSSGDSGSDTCDQGSGDFSTKGLSVSGIASTPYNVVIGGTDFSYSVANPPTNFWNTGTSTTSAKGYIPESTWNDSCAAGATSTTLATACTATIINQNSGSSATAGIDLVGGGGGPSGINTATSSNPAFGNPKPVWQNGVNGMPSDSARDLPDLSFFAGDGLNGSFYVVCQMDANTGTGSSTSSCDLNSPFADFQGVGGTSAGAPAFAGIMAIVDQKMGGRQGNANFVLYQLYKKNTAGTICTSGASPAGTCIFYDTVVGNNSVACQGGTTNCSDTSTAANQYGVLVDPNNTNTPAWTTTAGYDRGTGLGSINATNLVNAWSTASFSADTVAITSTSPTPVNITHGANVTFNVKVTQGSGSTVPTGTVSLVNPTGGATQLGIGDFSLNTSTTLNGSGTIAITTNTLPGGTYPVVAEYSGDGTFAPGTSAQVSVTVAKEASQTVVSLLNTSGSTPAAATSVPYGSSYILEIAVKDSGGNQCGAKVVGCPTGTVTLTDNGSALNDFSGSNSAKLNSQGIAEDQPVQLSTGSHSLAASYAGDNSFNASNSATDAVTITKATPSGITVGSSASTVSVNQPVTLTANITTASSGVGPTGTVTFFSNGAQIGSPASVTGTAASGLNGSNPVAASGTATLSTSFTSGGAKSITATYNGDSNYSTVGPSAAAALTVNTGTQANTTVVAANPTTITAGASVVLTATVTSSANNGPGITGAVQFMNGSAALGSAATCTATAGTASTPATCTATLTTAALTTVGANSITGVYSGDSNYASSTSVAITVTVNAPALVSTTTALTANTNSISSGGNVTFTATVTGASNAGAAPTGTVQFMNGSSALSTAATCTGSGTTCTATLTVALSMLTPPASMPRNTPNLPTAPLYIVTTLLFLAFLLGLRRVPAARRPVFAYVGVLLFAGIVAGIAGCGGGSSNGGGTAHTDSVTAVYSGDSKYSGSTSSAVSISIH